MNLLRHSLKIAARLLLRHRLQSVTSIVGLAVGFTCFALSVTWVRHEMSHDAFHEGADRIFAVTTESIFAEHNRKRTNPYPLAARLAETLPGIEAACSAMPFEAQATVDDVSAKIAIVQVDSSFLSLFRFKPIEGDLSFTLPGSRSAAITDRKARQLFGDDSPIGKRITAHYIDYTISAVVPAWNRPSNYPFDLLVSIDRTNPWNVSFCHTLVKIAPGVDPKAFTRQLAELTFNEEHIVIKNLEALPLASLRYSDPEVQRQVKFRHILLFSIAGLLVILCSLFNYLALSTGRLRARARELSLRVICGASRLSIYTLLSAEILLVMLLATAAGLLLQLLVMPAFCLLSDIPRTAALHAESFLYILAVILAALALFIILLAIARRQSLLSLAGRRRGNRARAWLVGLQLVISIGFIFCPVVMLRQMHHLQRDNLGFHYENTAALISWMQQLPVADLEQKIKQLPSVTSTLLAIQPLVHTFTRSSNSYGKDDGLENIEEPVYVYLNDISREFAEHYRLQLVDGQMLDDNEPRENVLVNETLVRRFGWDNPVGKSFGKHVVKGVIRDIHDGSPSAPTRPALYRDAGDAHKNSVLFSYLPGHWEECRQAIATLLADANADPDAYRLVNIEEAIGEYFKSEDALLKLLGFMAVVCLVLCTFGFISMISLDREERRREIAIRKVNGATARDILLSYVRFHAVLLLLAALVAFPLARLVMQRWMEQYARQAGIPLAIDLAILLFLALLALAATGWHVHRASVENPTDALKSN